MGLYERNNKWVEVSNWVSKNKMLGDSIGYVKTKN